MTTTMLMMIACNVKINSNNSTRRSQTHTLNHLAQFANVRVHAECVCVCGGAWLGAEYMHFSVCVSVLCAQKACAHTFAKRRSPPSHTCTHKNSHTSSVRTGRSCVVSFAQSHKQNKKKKNAHTFAHAKKTNKTLASRARAPSRCPQCAAAQPVCNFHSLSHAEKT